MSGPALCAKQKRPTISAKETYDMSGPALCAEQGRRISIVGGNGSLVTAADDGSRDEVSASLDEVSASQLWRLRGRAGLVQREGVFVSAGRRRTWRQCDANAISSAWQVTM